MNGPVSAPVTFPALRPRALLWAVGLLAVLGLTSACSPSFGSGRAAAVLEAGRLQADALGLAIAAGDAARGNLDGIDELKSLREQIAARIARLAEGDAALAIPAPGDSQKAALEGVTREWDGLKGDLQRIVSVQDALLDAVDSAQELAAGAALLQARLDELARQRAEAGSPAAEQYSLMRGVLASERMQRSTGIILSGGAAGVSAADRLARDALLLERTVDALRDGDAALGVQRLGGGPERSALDEVLAAHQRVGPAVEALLETAPALLDAVDAADLLRSDAQRMAGRVDELAASY